jgi:predicted GNAT family acetyltransferase
VLVLLTDTAGTERIDQMEAEYGSQGLEPRVQIVPSSDPTDLDARLERRGYAVEAPVDVLVAELSDATVTVPRTDLVTRVASAIDVGAFSSFGEDSGALARIEGYARLMAGIGPSHLVVSAYVDGVVAALGLGVVEQDWLGVFGMVTRSSMRRRGAARAVLTELAQQATAHGASHAYLQVEVDNAAARELYSSVGFKHSHPYHYRVLRRVGSPPADR